MGYKAVLFDLFGTLVDNFPPGEFERVAAAMAMTVGLPPEPFYRRWGEEYCRRDLGHCGGVEASVQTVSRAFGIVATEEQTTVAARLWIDLLQGILTPRKDAVTTLTELRGRGYKVGLLSNCGEEVPGIWEGTPAAHLFDASVYSCAVGLAKPDPELYRLACGRLNVSPNECLYVGDGSDYELRHAALVGMCPVLIRVPYESLDDPYHPDAKDWQGRAITSLSEVLLLLSGD